MAARLAIADGLSARFKNWTRSDSAKRRARPPPTRCADRRTASLHRPREAWLALRNRAASAVYSNSSITRILPAHSPAEALELADVLVGHYYQGAREDVASTAPRWRSDLGCRS